MVAHSMASWLSAASCIELCQGRLANGLQGSGVEIDFPTEIEDHSEL